MLSLVERENCFMTFVFNFAGKYVVITGILQMNLIPIEKVCIKISNLVKY